MADIRLGNNNTVYKVGSGDCIIYLGTTLLYSGGTPPTPPHDYSTDYLTFVAKEDSTFQFTNSIDYSLDNGSTWTTLASNTSTPSIAAGEKILWKATLTPSSNGIGQFSSTGQFDAEGNAMSLLYGDNFIGQTSLSGKNYAFKNLFRSCTNLISAENLSLPATTLETDCYISMFYNCTSLTTAPELPATTLAARCYREMFRGCTNLNYIKCLATNISATFCVYQWVYNVASNGTFVKDASMTDWPTGNDGIPSNWTVVDYTP